MNFFKLIVKQAKDYKYLKEYSVTWGRSNIYRHLNEDIWMYVDGDWKPMQFTYSELTNAISNSNVWDIKELTEKEVFMELL